MARKALAVVLLLILACGALISGCGGLEAQAREYIREGDDLYADAEKTSQGLVETKSELLGVFLANDAEKLVSMEETVVNVMSEAYQATLTSGEAAAKYGKVLEMEDVEEYKEYASLMLEAIDKQQEAMTVGRQLAGELLVVIEDIKAGNPHDLKDVIKTGSQSIILLDEYEDEINEIEREARIYARDHNIFD